MLQRFIAVFLSPILLSACSFQAVTITPPAQDVQPTPLHVQESIATATVTPVIVAATEQPLPTFQFDCSRAPAPHVGIGQQVIVLVDNSDKLKLRSEPKILPDTVIKELDQSTRLVIEQGPFCVHSDETSESYWFWQVKVLPDGETGWIADGDSLHYFIAESTAVAVRTTTAIICKGLPAPHVEIGQQVLVLTENTDKLKLREIPVLSPDTVVMDLDTLTKLNILEGPVCAYSNETKIYYWLWKVQVLPGGEIGWVAEGDFFRNFIDEERNMQQFLGRQFALSRLGEGFLFVLA